MSDEGLREAYSRAIATRTPGERAACPAPEAILALVRREGVEGHRLAILDHVMACSACRREFELLRAIEVAGAEATRAEAGSPAASSRASGPGRIVGHIRWRQWAPLAAAAVVAVVLAVGPGRALWERGPEPVRGGGEALALIAPAGNTTTSGAATSFVWHSAASAERYTLELLTSGGAVALSRTTTDTAATVVLPPTLAPGAYRWWVVATTADGSEARSETRTLLLRGR